MQHPTSPRASRPLFSAFSSRSSTALAAFALSLSSALFGCATNEPAQPEPEPKAEAEAKGEAKGDPTKGDQAKQAAEQGSQAKAPRKSFGTPITETKTVALTDIAKEPGKFADQTVRTEGKVSAVCKKAGCWMEITDESGAAHVKMAGHSFTVPKDSSGRRAVVQAKVVAEKGESCGGTGDGCCGGGDKQADGPLAKVELEATGVELLD